MNKKITRLQLLKRWIPLSSGSINIMHDSIGVVRAYTLYSDPSSEKRCPSLQQPRPKGSWGSREPSRKSLALSGAFSLIFVTTLKYVPIFLRNGEGHFTSEAAHRLL